MSKTIRWQTRSEYSHASLILPDGQCVEAWHKGGVQITNSPYALHPDNPSIDIFMVPLPANTAMVVSEFALKQKGKGYDFPGVFGFLTRQDQNERKSQKKWFCSELVFAALLHAETRLLMRCEPWQVSPGMLRLSNMLIYSYSVTSLGSYREKAMTQ